MSACTASLDLPLFLEEHCARIRRSRSTVLFRRGEKAFGVFLIFSGKVSLDPEIPQTPLHCYGPGALVGLPATLTRRNYAMTAIVIEDAELGFLPPQVLDPLMKSNSDFCQELLKLLSERMLEIQHVHKALLQTGDEPSSKAFHPSRDQEAA